MSPSWFSHTHLQHPVARCLCLPLPSTFTFEKMAAALSSTSALATRPSVAAKRATQTRAVRVVRVQAQQQGEMSPAASGP